jgi:2-polyprenyl-3-methyl-5-hydroxy-6-metoxy-1,4-benzoquinol methylase
MSKCPLCLSEQVTQLLHLKDFPIYLHPVDQEEIKNISGKHVINLNYDYCRSCNHAFQPHYDKHLLESVYKFYYFTETMPDFAISLINDCLNVIESNIVLTSENNKILEIGSSSGDFLLNLKNRYPASEVTGVDPNVENVEIANKKGCKTIQAFFNKKTALTFTDKYDFIVLRQVIEHIFDLDDFFSALVVVSNEKTQLIIETQSLDWSFEKESIDPYQSEHIHVFSIHSLATFAKKYGWIISWYSVTNVGNLIAGFKKTEVEFAVDYFSYHNSLSSYVTNLKNYIYANTECKDVVYWGAGSAGRTILYLSDVIPAAIIDGNINKVGKVFVGVDQIVKYSDDYIDRVIDNGKDINSVVVICSLFYKEIREVLRSKGWRGNILTPFEHF